VSHAGERHDGVLDVRRARAAIRQRVEQVENRLTKHRSGAVGCSRGQAQL
jgi:hypothetical protein